MELEKNRNKAPGLAGSPALCRLGCRMAVSSCHRGPPGSGSCGEAGGEATSLKTTSGGWVDGVSSVRKLGSEDLGAEVQVVASWLGVDG